MLEAWSAPSAIATAGLGGGFEIGAEVIALRECTDHLGESFSKAGAFGNPEII